MASENLYIVKRSKFDARNPTQPVYDIALPATFTNLNDAKQYAKRVLPKEGYDIKFFPVYDVKDLSLHELCLTKAKQRHACVFLSTYLLSLF